MSRLTTVMLAGALALWHGAAQAQLAPGQAFRDCPECPEMVVLPAGSLYMGSPAHEARRDADEGPQRRVQLARPFAIGRYEVRATEFAKFLSETGYPVDSSCEGRGYATLPGAANARWRDPGFRLGARHPISCVRWSDAVAYTRWLGRKTGKRYRLPSEAEWEYAARAGTATARHWGNPIGRGQANCDGCGSRWDDRRTAPVGSFAPNSFGLYDMLGNNWEWVKDCYTRSHDQRPLDGAAFVGGLCKERVMRGGSFESDPRRLRAANRNKHRAGDIDNDFGFRVLREIDQPRPVTAAPVPALAPAPQLAPAPALATPVAPAQAPVAPAMPAAPAPVTKTTIKLPPLPPAPPARPASPPEPEPEQATAAPPAARLFPVIPTLPDAPAAQTPAPTAQTPAPESPKSGLLDTVPPPPPLPPLND